MRRRDPARFPLSQRRSSHAQSAEDPGPVSGRDPRSLVRNSHDDLCVRRGSALGFGRTRLDCHAHAARRSVRHGVIEQNPENLLDSGAVRHRQRARRGIHDLEGPIGRQCIPHVPRQGCHVKGIRGRLVRAGIET